ncbi:failed axon connections homolog isoform X2 [Oratosquilla oratoria]
MASAGLSMLWPQDWAGRFCSAAIFVGICFAARRVHRSIKMKNKRKQWDAVGKDVVLLHQFWRGKYCPNLSPFALKVESFIRLANIEYKVDFDTPFGPKKKCPWMTLNGEDIADSEFMLERLKNQFGVTLDEHLEESKKCNLEAARVLADEHLFWCVITYRYWHDRCKTFLTTQTFPKITVFFFNWFMPRAIKKKATMQGIGVHSQDEVFNICKKDVATLSGILGEDAYFGGEKPCSADCAIFGQLAQLCWNAPGTRYEALIVDAYPNLKHYCYRMKELVFPDWNQLLNPPKNN